MSLRITKTLLTIVVLFCLGDAYAQAPLAYYDQRIYFGFRGGVNLASIQGDYNIPEFVSTNFAYKNRLTGHFGAVLNYHVTRGVAFQGEVNYSMMGADVENNRQGVVVQALNFLEIPAIVRFMGGNPKRTQFFVEMGPVAGIALVANDHYADDRTLKTKENYRGASYGVLGGAGLQFYAKKYRVVLSGRYTMGFTDMHEYELVTNKVRAFSFSLTIMKDIFYYY